MYIEGLHLQGAGESEEISEDSNGVINARSRGY